VRSRNSNNIAGRRAQPTSKSSSGWAKIGSIIVPVDVATNVNLCIIREGQRIGISIAQLPEIGRSGRPKKFPET
jgi:hypothetical protein